MWVEQNLYKQTKLEVTDKPSTTTTTTTTTTTQTHKFFHRSPVSSLAKLKENSARPSYRRSSRARSVWGYVLGRHRASKG
jgi:hypothetical protein